ncbi:5-formyltetrahydrofolate cyclo-ligase [Spirochaeta thermophila]|nr:5-formyltetrahydrofolate cyclo-ligase [Spirochaeta thermophila]
MHRGAPMREEKARLRAVLRARVAGMGAQAREEAGRAIRERIAAWGRWRAARTVGGFLPLRDEPDVRPLLDEALREGKRVYVPRIAGGGIGWGRYGPGVRLVRHELGFLQPEEEGERGVRPEVVLVPGLGFDRAGRRLGRGGGWYDRLLVGEARAVGVCFACQVVEAVPEEEHDVRVAYVVTEQGFFRCYT